MTDGTETALVLRNCDAQLRSHGGFQWPASGAVEAKDWSPVAECGRGLHGWLWGEGDGSLGYHDPDAKWLVVRVVLAEIIDLSGKVKFPRGEVVFCGAVDEATAYLAAHGGASRAIVRGTATAGDGGTATAGDGGTIAILHWNGKRWKSRIAQMKDEDGDGELEPGKYRLDNSGNFVKVVD